MNEGNKDVKCINVCFHKAAKPSYHRNHPYKIPLVQYTNLYLFCLEYVQLNFHELHSFYWMAHTHEETKTSEIRLECKPLVQNATPLLRFVQDMEENSALQP